MIMNDPDRNTTPGLQLSSFRAIDKMRPSRYVVPSTVFKENFPFNYHFYFDSQNFVPDADITEQPDDRVFLYRR